MIECTLVYHFSLDNAKIFLYTTLYSKIFYPPVRIRVPVCLKRLLLFWAWWYLK